MAKELVENYRRILREEKIYFIEFSDIEVRCGSPALKASYVDDFRKLAEKKFTSFKDHSVERIVLLKNEVKYFFGFSSTGKTYYNFRLGKIVPTMEDVMKIVRAASVWGTG